MNERGRAVLRSMGDACSLPSLTKPAHANRLPEEGRALFAAEARCTDLYQLCRGDLSHSACGTELLAKSGCQTMKLTQKDEEH
jgi:hypothetical protein